jgi:acyl-CoA thioester hydrolase
MGQDSFGLGDLGWRGTINHWECDEMGRLEMRFYVALAAQALVSSAVLAGAAADDAQRPVEQHIRFLTELRPNVPAEVRNFRLPRGPEPFNVLQVVQRSDDAEPLAAIRSSFASSAGSGLREIASCPPYATYRGLEPSQPLPESPRRTDLEVTGVGMIGEADCDRSGVARGETILGRVAEATPHLMGSFSRMAQELTGHRLGGATVEARLHYMRWPKAGDVVQVRSGLLGLDGRTQRLGHWVSDPVTGELYARVECLALMFDLEARALAKLPPEVVVAMQAQLSKVTA